MRRGMLLILLLALLLPLCACAAKTDQPKYIAITFDDGPEYKYSPAMLDGLAERNVHATFFMVGMWTKGKDEIISRVQNEGHQIGSHTFSHEMLTDMTDDEIRAEIRGFEETMNGFTGESGFWLRPPFGACDERVSALCDVPVILWSIDPAAGKTVSAKTMERRIVRQARDGAIILMHDTTPENVEASLAAIDSLQEKGFVFVTIEELFAIKGLEPQPGTVYREVR